MKIAELFAEIGFEIKGKDQLATVDKALANVEAGATRLLVGVGALNAIFYTMVATATQAGTALEKFAVNTGLSSEELQKWQRAGRMAGISANEITSAIYAIQDAQMKIRTGQGGDTAPFNIFGIGTAEDPYRVLQKLSASIQQYQPAFARMMLQRMGMGEDMYQFLKRLTPEMTKLNQQLIVTNQEQHQLFALNASWQRFLTTITAIKDRFVGAMAPALSRILDLLSLLAEQLSTFINWLESGTSAANTMRMSLLGIVVALTALALILPVVIGGIAFLTSSVGALTLEVAPILIVIGLMAAALITIILLIQDFWVAAEGGDSFGNWNTGLLLTVDNVNKLASAIQYIIDLWDEFKDSIKSGTGFFSLMPLGIGAPGFLSSMLAPKFGPQNQSTSQSQQNNVNIHVHGSEDPRTTGTAAYEAAQRETINRAFFQRPLPAK